jgi:hypothetical protein
MKVAVLLFGQPRDAINCSKSIVNNIINPNNVDVFFHTWYDENDLYMEKGEKDRSNCELGKGIDKQLIDIYKPKSYCIEPQKFNNFNNYDNDYFKCPEKYIDNISKCGKNKELTKEEVKLRCIKYSHISQFYSIFKANMLKEEYSLEHNIYYDYVIKIRFDVICNNLIVINNSIPNDTLLFQNIGQPDQLVSDWFHISSNEIMNIVCSLFLKLKYLNNTKGYLKQSDRLPITLWETNTNTMGPEVFIRDYLYLHKIPWKGINFNIKLSKNT